MGGGAWGREASFAATMLRSRIGLVAVRLLLDLTQIVGIDPHLVELLRRAFAPDR